MPSPLPPELLAYIYSAMTTRRLPKPASLESIVERVDQQRPGEITGDTVPTGFPSLDKLLGGGLRRRDLVLLGGDIGSGKSALALGMALRVAQQGLGVAFLSGEMDEGRLMERALAIEGRASVDELRTATLNDQARAGIGAAAVRLRGLPLAMPALAAPDFETMDERLDAIPQLALVVVDYLQLVPPPAGAVRQTQDEDAALNLRRLKALALERQVALLVLAQLPRLDPARENPRPILDDFGHLGATKQHPDVVLALFREEMYRPDGGVDGAAELIVAKNRNGPTGFVDLYFYRRWMRFEDMVDPDR
jgi:replicative DNA helicase